MFVKQPMLKVNLSLNNYGGTAIADLLLKILVSWLSLASIVAESMT